MPTINNKKHLGRDLGQTCFGLRERERERVKKVLFLGIFPGKKSANGS